MHKFWQFHFVEQVLLLSWRFETQASSLCSFNGAKINHRISRKIVFDRGTLKTTFTMKGDTDFTF